MYMRQSFIEKTQTHKRRRIVFSPPIIPLGQFLRCYYDVMLLRFKVVGIDMHIQMFECWNVVLELGYVSGVTECTVHLYSSHTSIHICEIWV